MPLLSRRRTYEVLERVRGNDRTAMWINGFIVVLVFINIVAVIIESVESVYQAHRLAFDLIEYVSVIVFGAEYLLRLWAYAENEQAGPTVVKRRWRYATSLFGLVDLIAVVPTILSIFMPGIDLRSLRAIRLLRILKFTHYSYALQDLGRSLYEERRAFTASFYVLGVVIIMASTLLYLAEHQAQPDKFGSIPDAMWWAIITLTTVGYGDVSPITPMGKVLGGMVAIMGVCTVALITGILASSFAVQMQRRKAEFEAHIEEALSDNVLTDQELAFLQTLKDDMGISDMEFEKLHKRMVQQKTQRATSAPITPSD
jgi:voltage-gated potassium channel